jgi:Flp pilus assembly protein TadG
MSRGFSRRRRPLLGQAGTATLEFALVAIPFLFLLIAGTDLGRYFITKHSLHTLTDEAVRLTMVTCFNQTASCSLSSTNWQKVETNVPFLSPSSLNPTPTATQTLNTAIGIRTITVTATYPFAFILPAWTALNANSPITDTTSLQY